MPVCDYNMSFLEEVARFSRNSLRKTETSFTRGDGLKFIEKRDDAGNSYKIATGSRTLAFVEDTNPDLQIGEVLPGLFLGSADVASDEALLQKHGITHILTTTSMNLEYFPGKFAYKHISIDDLPSTDITKKFEECFSFINKALSRGMVLVHCMAGVSRSATIVIAYLMKTKAMDFKQAFDHVKSCRPAICPNEGFLKQLRCYKP